jgi:hypothetical protein
MIVGINLSVEAISADAEGFERRVLVGRRSRNEEASSDFSVAAARGFDSSRKPLHSTR